MNTKVLLLLLFAVSIGLWGPLSNDLDSKEILIPLSNNPEESTVIILKGKSVLICNLPKTDSFNYVMLKLVCAGDTLPIKKCRNARKGDYDVKFDLRDVPNGTYFIEIYSAPEKYTTYVSYIHGQALCVQVGDFSVDYNPPPTLEKNKEAFAANPHDAGALSRYLKPSPKIPSGDPSVIELAETITAGLTTDYEKIKAVHDWVSGNIWYDYDELYKGFSSEKSVLETLSSRRGVCIDYASLTASLLRAVGIPAKLQSGYVLNASADESWTEELISGNKCNHVWNEAYADGRWIVLDTTYDSNNTYKNEMFSTGTGMKNRRYFDISIEFLSADRYIVPSEFDPVGYR